MSVETDAGAQWLVELTQHLPRHGRLIAALRDAVAADERLRWFDVSCSLGAGLGDQFSDVDCGVGYAEPRSDEDLEALGTQLVSNVGAVTDVLAHVMERFPPGTIRFAVEYDDEVQLDLVLMPSAVMSGLRDREVAIVDKDGALAGTATSPVYGPPDEDRAREWVLTAWWWVSDVAKYLARDSRFEAADRIALVRQHALKLFAVSLDVPYPEFGLTSLLDYEPFRLPDGLAETYPLPSDRASVDGAASAVVAVLAECSAQAASHLGYDLSTPWEGRARTRLAAATR